MMSMLSKTRWGVLALVCVLAACSSTKPQPKELQAVSASLPVKQIWSAAFDGGLTPPRVQGKQLWVATATGKVLQLQLDTGKQDWSVDVGSPVRAGLGVSADGQSVAAVTALADLVLVRDAKTLWRQHLPASVVTPPLVAGGRVFVLTTDRSLYAFDAQTGVKLWQVTNTSQLLSLSAPTVLQSFQNSLLVGLGGRLSRINPDNGSVLGEVVVASSRGSNEVERLVEIVDGTTRQDNVLCVRAFQISVSCIDMQQYKTLWTSNASGFSGLAGDGQWLFAVDADGKLRSWQQGSGELRWVRDSLQWRGVTSPLLAGNTLIVGDAQGYVHFFAKQDGNAVNRLQTDGSAIAYAPVRAGQTVVVVTQKGGLYAYQPD
ncbi:PQQ-binding-like beta-propeller repeat protein [Curvibacter sp. CHRR-16]|uniref:PQQ-binding-like beta-propeller repeat protein n=1 Tax=Curvibacter sp. CHRR-16 TaxID=2835872 RepID=UPI001BDB547D|nr:PQQ-binding-like beta-propeller repeat protein [Curvibacter sp. CHRR-16]MBT0569237.1 PQQ-binding-like beta-propeller repeat protein [Curvibacter sp. CHRR-16]